MTAERSAPDDPPPPGAASFLAAAAALETIETAVRDARSGGPAGPAAPAAGAEQALASLLLLREVREQLAGWETGLIETARAAGASWSDLAAPLGVASRQAAERRYLRLRPGPAGSTGEERVSATRSRRAADRSVTAWARTQAADMRRLAGQITALTDLPAAAGTEVGHLDAALAADDAAGLLTPLTAIRPHLGAGHRDLAARIDTLTRHADRLRDSGSRSGKDGSSGTRTA
ncbi:HSP18 transcriptional regulator [Streptomyces sp. V4-01]|uniref:HSP18 transcriptional regulator n=1 Tax=Actinacidiphila polyblastidii TaxID=3110430 RepID=A0ABU7P3S3_9ACTN|nr:HSP18 transcriptional regulator [Streptomyces sp. V4-01]